MPRNHASLLRQAPNTSKWDFPDSIKFHVAVHTTQNHASLLRRAQYGFSRHNKIPRCSAYALGRSFKAIRFRHPDYDPHRAQKLISLSMSRHLSTRNISSKSMHAFLSNLARRQTDRQTNERGRAGENTNLLRCRM